MSDDYGTINFTTVTPDADHPERHYPTARWEGGARIVVSIAMLADATTDYPQYISWNGGDDLKLCQYTLKVVEHKEELLICERVWTDTFFGTRIDDCIPVQPGDYGFYEGEWWAKVPAPGLPSAKLSLHDITTHEDGTITVSPSILLERDYGDPPVHQRWHGYLEHGMWRKVE